MIIRVSVLWVYQTDILLHFYFLLEDHITLLSFVQDAGFGTIAISFCLVSMKHINS